MTLFEREYQRLNQAQRQAVDTIDGPVLVVAGPGTGKTQLLGMRVANIIRQTDTSPANILCLTFTDNAARNMRERLETVIGQAAYHVNVSTFHSFGAEIINQYPDFFTERQMIQQVDELGSYELLKDIFEELPHSNPLSAKICDEYVMLRDTLSVISWLKQNAVLPAELHSLLLSNKKFIDKFNAQLTEVFSAMPSPKLLEKYQILQKSMADYDGDILHFGFPDYSRECSQELAQAIELTDGSKRYAPKITEWRNKWCDKTADGKHVFKDGGRNYRKMQAVANVYQALLDSMSRQGLFDFDDMIMEAVHAMERNLELKANLQERYQYILVDEFQDTNKAQLRMLMALGDNPLFEKRPNIMAVGDDDQAIYAFQGAEVSNMVSFAKLYDQPAIINLNDNYRSSAEILSASQVVAGQISDRLQYISPEAHKSLEARANFKNHKLEHAVLPSELAQYAWVADQVKTYIDKGQLPEEIAILAPRHRYLERLVPYLARKNIPVAYERRENILEAPLIAQLITMAKLVVAIAENRQSDVDAYLGEIISYDFWGVSSEDIVKISIDCFSNHCHWLPTLLEHDNKLLSDIAEWLIYLARHCKTEPLEYILDSLLGIVADGTDSELDEAPERIIKPKFISPMRHFYFSTDIYEHSTDEYLALLGQLSTLRQRLRAWKPNKTLYIGDLVDFAQLHAQARIKIIDTNPHTQTTNAVQVMTAFKAKGLEFETVFVINAQDEVWGPTARQQSGRISLPKNMPIQPTGNSDDDKLRLLFVALTRAKCNLIVTSYSHDLQNRLSPGLSFIGGNSEDSEPINSNFKPHFVDKPAGAEAAEILATDWSYRFRQVIADKPTLFEPILADYKLSVTHLNNFIDIVSAGPDYFFVHNVLRFPEALTPPAAYGDAVHRSLHWFHTELRSKSKQPSTKQLQDYFVDMLSRKHLRPTDFSRLEERGRQALSKYISARGKVWNREDLIERGFNNEGAVVNQAKLSGKIDKMHFVAGNQVEVVDFKTGKPAVSWQGKDETEKIKLYKYRQQLLFYKLLLEHSASYNRKVKVSSGALEFIEVDDNNKLVDNLMLEYDPKELERLAILIGKIWQHIMDLNMPNTDKYPKTLKGIKTFEDDLLADKI